MRFQKRQRFILQVCALVLVATLVDCIQLSAQPKSDLPVVIITFDDADQTVYSRGFKIMQAKAPAWKATHFFPLVALSTQGHMSLAQVQEMEVAGWENGGHGVLHENLASIPLDSVRSQVAQVDSFFKANNLAMNSWAYAYGNYNDSVQSVVAKYVQNIRTSHDGAYVGEVNRLQLGYYAVRKEQTLQDIINRVEKARNDGSKIVIIGFHVILDPNEPESPDYFTRTPIFEGFIDYLLAHEYPVMDIRDAMTRVLTAY